MSAAPSRTTHRPGRPAWKSGSVASVSERQLDEHSIRVDPSRRFNFDFAMSPCAACNAHRVQESAYKLRVECDLPGKHQLTVALLPPPCAISRQIGPGPE